jgi:hypothetical protein
LRENQHHTTDIEQDTKQGGSQSLYLEQNNADVEKLLANIEPVLRDAHIDQKVISQGIPTFDVNTQSRVSHIHPFTSLGDIRMKRRRRVRVHIGTIQLEEEEAEYHDRVYSYVKYTMKLRIVSCTFFGPDALVVHQAAMSAWKIQLIATLHAQHVAIAIAIAIAMQDNAIKVIREKITRRYARIYMNGQQLQLS